MPVIEPPPTTPPGGATLFPKMAKKPKKRKGTSVAAKSGGKFPPAKAKAVKKQAHPGFQNLVKSGVPPAALAAASRKASPAAKAKNPNLKKVKGSAKGKKGY